ncbi:hypothetical protein [Streptomyces sp. NPDC050534]|uniref:hypothetical protein n=1 Tax=Streptomyces sp. NPDC050534 TaxID=3365625 RepID=UPI0037A41508
MAETDIEGAGRGSPPGEDATAATDGVTAGSVHPRDATGRLDPADTLGTGFVPR